MSILYRNVRFVLFRKNSNVKSLTLPFASKSRPKGFLTPLPLTNSCPKPNHTTSGKQGWEMIPPLGTYLLKLGYGRTTGRTDISIATRSSKTSEILRKRMRRGILKRWRFNFQKLNVNTSYLFHSDESSNVVCEWLCWSSFCLTNLSTKAAFTLTPCRNVSPFW